MVDINKLKGKIVEKGLSVEKLAAALSMNKSTLYRKLSSGEDITVGEATQISKVLCLSAEDIHAIFFSNAVA